MTLVYDSSGLLSFATKKKGLRNIHLSNSDHKISCSTTVASEEITWNIASPLSYHWKTGLNNPKRQHVFVVPSNNGHFWGLMSICLLFLNFVHTEAWAAAKLLVLTKSKTQSDNEKSMRNSEPLLRLVCQTEQPLMRVEAQSVGPPLSYLAAEGIPVDQQCCSGGPAVSQPELHDCRLETPSKCLEGGIPVASHYSWAMTGRSSGGSESGRWIGVSSGTGVRATPSLGLACATFCIKILLCTSKGT